jgi:hypothetical protein
MLHNEYYSKGLVEKKSLVGGLKGRYSKTNWSVVNRQSSNCDRDYDSDWEFSLDLRASLWRENF